MSELGYEVSSVGITSYYRNLVDTLVIDETDRGQASSIAALGLSTHTTGTVMRILEDKVELAREICRIADVG